MYDTPLHLKYKTCHFKTSVPTSKGTVADYFEHKQSTYLHTDIGFSVHCEVPTGYVYVTYTKFER